MVLDWISEQAAALGMDNMNAWLITAIFYAVVMIFVWLDPANLGMATKIMLRDRLLITVLLPFGFYYAVLWQLNRG